MNQTDQTNPTLGLAVEKYKTYLATGRPQLLRDAIETLASTELTSDDVIRREYLVYRVSLTGWAGIPGQAIDIRRVVACSAKRILGQTVPGRRRPDVVKHFADSRLSRSGFRDGDLVVEQALNAGPIWVLAETADHRFARLLPTDSVTGYTNCPLGKEPNPLLAEAELFVGHVDGIEVERIAKVARAGGSEGLEEIDLVALAELLVIANRVPAARRILSRLPTSPEWDIQRRATLAFATALAGREIERPIDDSAGWVVVPIRRVESREGIPRYVDSVWTPRSIPPRPRQRRSITIEQPFVTTLERAEIHLGSIILDHNGDFVLDEPAANPAFDFVAGRWQHVFGSPTRLREVLLRLPPAPSREIREAASILGRCSSNYFHSLIEYIPRILALERMDPDCNLPALVNTDLPPASLEALTILSGGRELVAVAADEVVHVERLHVPSFHTYHPDTPTLPWIAGAGVHRPTLLEARRRWLDAAGAEPGDRRVLLLRESGVRGLVNAERLARIASRRGFEPVDPAKLSFVEQVRLVHGSAIISGVGGAALANLLFCRPGAKVLGLVSEHLADFTMQAHLADLAGAEFTYVTGPSKAKASSATHHRDRLHSDFYINQFRYRLALRKACAGSIHGETRQRWPELMRQISSHLRS